MDGLSSVLDALGDGDLAGLGDGELLDRTAALVAARNRIEAELARTVRAADVRRAAEHDGLTTMRSWLRGHARLSAAEAGRVVRAGRVLEHLPAVARAFAAGQVSAEQVAAVVPVVTSERVAAAAEQGVELAEVDAVLAEVAATRPHRALRQVVGHYLARLDPDGTEPDPTEGRSVSIARHSDGSITARVELDAVGGEKFQAALESIAAAGRCAGDLRTRAQQLGDALVQLCDLALASGTLPVLRIVKPHVAVTIPLEDLADSATGPGSAELGFGATISAARARWIACDATVTRIVLSPEGLPLDLGRSARVVPPHLRRAVEHRDRGCVFTGCTAPTHFCDVHHRLEWINGAQTNLENSALLCERHHTEVHHGFRVQRGSDGRWRTWRPDGTEILLPPERPATAA
ncbi:DUF222 domain-containing protein [Geodermatophilus sp. CPCC 206100]|uniref:HNH endonuclease signature motif containing protein n=1 Tax=Geodermatophilus sp. CPCC 206100 TaxID=3020054 RepID=UPI003B00C7FE